MRHKTVVLKSWNDIHKYAGRGWVYRGQRSAKWALRTSLERWCDRWRVGRTKRAAVEIRLSREFRRAYHDYATHIPSQGSVIEWLALMQHHGAPTRLLDFSYSVYVAAYFPLCQDP